MLFFFIRHKMLDKGVNKSMTEQKNNLRICRLKAGHEKAYEFAEKLGILPTTLSALENGKANPSFSLVKKLAELCECSIEELGF